MPRVVQRDGYVVTGCGGCGAWPVRDSGDAERHAENFMAPCRCGMRTCLVCEQRGHVLESGARCPGIAG